MRLGDGRETKNEENECKLKFMKWRVVKMGLKNGKNAVLLI